MTDILDARIAELEAQKEKNAVTIDRLLDKSDSMDLMHQQMLDALKHAEAILTYARFFSTNKRGDGPSTTTTVAREKVRTAIAKAELSAGTAPGRIGELT